MDKKTFCKLYNTGHYRDIVFKFCVENGKSEEETNIFVTLLEYPQFSDILLICLDYICLNISKETPITFLYNNQHQLIKAF